MILIDINLLVYASSSQSPDHEMARKWLESQLTGTTKVALPWICLLGFLRIATNPRAFERPATLTEAWGQVRSWLSCPVVWIPEPTDQHAAVFESLLPHAGQGGNLLQDAHLAALAIEHGLTLASADGDFARFPELRWINPLREKPKKKN